MSCVIGTGVSLAAGAGSVAAALVVTVMEEANIELPDRGRSDSGRLAGWWLELLLPVALFALGGAVRLAAARGLSFHVDEQFSLLGAQMVAERGVPLLPSGVPYLHGATLSYLLAPLVRLGLDDLATLRLVSAGAGAVAVVLAYGLARDALGPRWAGLLAAVPVALDPLGVQWGGHVRMYALLQALVLALVWIFLRIVRDGPTPRRAGALAVVFWAATFTHLEAALLLPPLVLAAFALRDRLDPGARRLLGTALGACALAPITLVAATRALGAVADQRPEALPDEAFLGEHMVNLGHLLQPDLADWRGLFAHNAFAELMPPLLVMLSGLLVARCVFPGDGADVGPPPRVVGALLACYWLPIVAIASFTVAQQPRHLLFLHPLGYAIVAVAAADLARGTRRHLRRPARVAAAAIAVAAVAAPAAGLWHLAGHPVVEADYATAMRYVADHHVPGQPVITTFPPIAYLALGGGADLRYLVRLGDGSLVQRYTVRTAAGTDVDRWVGSPAVTSVADLCHLLMERSDAWVVVDDGRLDADWGYRGDAATVLRGTTVRVLDAVGGAFVARAAPAAEWSSAAMEVCHSAAATTDAGPAPEASSERLAARAAPTTMYRRQLLVVIGAWPGVEAFRVRPPSDEPAYSRAPSGPGDLRRGSSGAWPWWGRGEVEPRSMNVCGKRCSVGAGSFRSRATRH